MMGWMETLSKTKHENVKQRLSAEADQQMQTDRNSLLRSLGERFKTEANKSPPMVLFSARELQHHGME